jgi:hypothetical protein
MTHLPCAVLLSVVCWFDAAVAADAGMSHLRMDEVFWPWRSGDHAREGRNIQVDPDP